MAITSDIRYCKRCQRAGNNHDKHHVFGVRNDRDTTIDLCRACHRWVHDNPEQAYKLGLLKRMSGSTTKKKESKPKKWQINKKHSSSDKWKLDFSKKYKKKG